MHRRGGWRQRLRIAGARDAEIAEAGVPAFLRRPVAEFGDVTIRHLDELKFAVVCRDF